MCDTTMARKRQATSYLRKIKKPVIEKKRRDRINSCLSELKAILMDNIKLHGETQTSKLDKADILEMTVSHLRQIQHQQLSVAMAASASVAQQYQEGFVECAKESVRYMDSTQVYPRGMSARLERQLAYASVYAPSVDTHGHTTLPVRSAYLEPNKHNTHRHSPQNIVSTRNPTEPVRVVIPMKCETDTACDISLCSPDSIELGGEASNMSTSFGSKSDNQTISCSTYSVSPSHSSLLQVSAPSYVSDNNNISTTVGTTTVSNLTIPTPVLVNISPKVKTPKGSFLEIPACVPVSISPPQPPQQSVWRPF